MIRRSFAAVVCLLFTLVAARAQSNYAVVRGSILDPQHRPVPGAHVHVSSTETGAEREVAANGTGLYEIAGLQPGSYELAVESSGFKQAKETLNLEVGQQATIDMQLSLAGDSQTVTVKSSAGELLKTEDASVGEVVDQRSVDSLPLNGRMLIDLVLTVPGAHVSHGASTGDMNPLYWRPGQRSAVSIGGSRPNANYFLLDGATNTDPTFSTQNLSASPDAVQEFQVQTGSYCGGHGRRGRRSDQYRDPHGHGDVSRHGLRISAQRRPGRALVQRDEQREFPGPEQFWRVGGRPGVARGQDIFLCELRRAAAR